MSRLIDLRSDTVTRPTPEMRKAMYEAEVGDDVFAEDPTIHELEEEVAGILGKEAALYVPSGTMANQIAINVQTKSGDEVFCEAGAHIFNYESGAPSFLSHVQLHPIEGIRGVFTREQVEERLRPDNDHFPPAGMIEIENTHNRSGGNVWHLMEVRRLFELSREQNLAMHLDGARLWNAAAASGTQEKDWAQYADSVSVCFSKGLGAPVGSAIVGSKEFIIEAHRARKRFGGGMRQAGIIAAGALYAVRNHRKRLVDDHHRAKTLAEGLVEIDGFTVDLDHLATNIIILDVAERGLAAARFAETVRTEGILVTFAGKSKVRFVTHLGLDDNDIQETITILRRLYG